MIIVLHEWEKFFYRILQKFTPTWYLQKFFGYDKAQIKREAKKNDSTDSNDKKQQQHSAEQQKPDPGEKLLLAGDLDHGEDGGSNFSVYLPAENGLLNELLGGAEIGWTRRCPTRCGRTCQWNEESALLYL